MYFKRILLVLLVPLVSHWACPTFASLGDQMMYFLNCASDCYEHRCSTSQKQRVFGLNQRWWDQMLGWDCDEECRYHCQWNTIKYLQNQKSFTHTQLPQFYGKWTFVRWFGLQEPASAFFSLFNFLSHLIAWRLYVRTVMQLKPGLLSTSSASAQQSSLNRLIETLVRPIDPMFWMHCVNAFFALNAWMWSTTFHAKETNFTERMDYCAALLFVMSSCYVAIVKLVWHRSAKSSSDSSCGFKQIALAMAMIAFYLNHVHKLIQSHFDYDYNMRINVFFGIGGSLAWFVWAYQSYTFNRSKHVLKAVLALSLMHVALLLEIFDFPPVAFVLDAHACWHLATIPMPFLWYSFLADEARLLYKLRS